MGLDELQLNPFYDSIENDVLSEFYVPVLSKSQTYDRLAGFFSSSALAVAARGIGQLIRNNGRMRLVAGAKLRESDVQAITEGKEDPGSAISRLALADLSHIETSFVKDHVAALGWMIANDLLEIRIAVPLSREQIPLDQVTVDNIGMFHQKVGIFRDSFGNCVSFSGSVNESATAWIENVEEFKVFRSWIAAENPYLRNDQEKFDRYWHGNAPGVLILDAPQAVRKKLIQIAPDKIEQLSLQFEGSGRRPALRPYQSEAVNAWLNHGERGILEMATGTGKTYAAIACIREVLKQKSRRAIIISCPFLHLIEQWNQSLRRFGLHAMGLHGGIPNWADKLANEVLDFNSGVAKKFIIVTTHDTFSSERFQEIVERLSDPAFLIADEVHWLGAPERRKGLLESYAPRLGLSATPARWLDDEGTAVVSSFFGGTVFEFPLSKAIPEYLVPYRYYPHFVQLNADELEEYKRMTAKIAREYSSRKSDDNNQSYELYCILRQKIVVNARQKYQALDTILDAIEDVRYCLIYCSEHQIDSVCEALNKRGIIQHTFTANEGIWQRQELLSSFAQGHCQVLVAMKVLDEGVDLPETRLAIILASSGNPRQFIQRRGRILRRAPGKDLAVIHDIIVIPNMTGHISPEYLELEKRILRKELLRYREFAMASQNPTYALNLILPIQRRYSVDSR